MRNLFDKIKKNNNGFTLVELIVVIAVLAVITVVIAPAYIKYVEKARVGTDENAIGEIAHIAEVEYVELNAKGIVSGDAAIVVSCDKPMSVGPATVGDAEDTALANAVNEVMGNYDTKSDTYGDGEVTITVNGNGNATVGSVVKNDPTDPETDPETDPTEVDCALCDCKYAPEYEELHNAVTHKQIEKKENTYKQGCIKCDAEWYACPICHRTSTSEQLVTYNKDAYAGWWEHDYECSKCHRTWD